MNIAVCVKQALDEAELRADASGRPILSGAQSKMSTFDRNAVEEAVRIKEAKGGSVVVITIGHPDGKKTVKEALAMGCDRAILVASTVELDSLSTSYYLARAIQRSGPFDAILMAEGASDTYQGMVGPMVAEWLGLPFLGYSKKLELGDGTARSESAMDERTDVLEAPLPAIVAVVSEINSPRYPTLLQIMQASKKPIEEIAFDSLKDGRAPPVRLQVAEVKVQSVNRKRILFEGSPEESAQKLLEALRREGVI